MVGDLVKNLRINIKHSRNIITQNKEPAKHKLQIHAILTIIVFVDASKITIDGYTMTFSVVQNSNLEGLNTTNKTMQKKNSLNQKTNF